MSNKDILRLIEVAAISYDLSKSIRLWHWAAAALFYKIRAEQMKEHEAYSFNLLVQHDIAVSRFNMVMEEN